MSLKMKLPGEVTCPGCGREGFNCVIDQDRPADAEPILPSVGDVACFLCCNQCVEVVEDGLRPISQHEALLRNVPRLMRLRADKP